MKKYGLTGLAGAGKDTAGVILAKMVNQECEAIATPMKHLVHILLGVSPDQALDRELKETVHRQYITYDALHNCADMYYSLGLGKYMEFPDAWDQWVALLDIKLPDEAYGDLYIDRSLRQVYQAIGTEWGRTTDADIWIKKFPIGKIATDVRMDNEAKWLINQGYEILEIDNDRVIPVNAHSTEAGLSVEVPRQVIPNHGTMNELYKVLKDVVANDLR